MNRVIGVLFALATIAIVAFAILNTGNYRSMCFTAEEEVASTTIEVVETVVEENIPDAEGTEDIVIEPLTLSTDVVEGEDIVEEPIAPIAVQ